MIPLCPYCGSESPEHCDIQEDYGCCPWSESDEYEALLAAEDGKDE